MEVQVGVLVTTPAFFAPLGPGVVRSQAGAVRNARLRGVDRWLSVNQRACVRKASDHQRL